MICNPDETAVAESVISDPTVKSAMATELAAYALAQIAVPGPVAVAVELAKLQVLVALLPETTGAEKLVMLHEAKDDPPGVVSGDAG